MRPFNEFKKFLCYHPVLGKGDESGGFCIVSMNFVSHFAVIFSDEGGWDHVSVSCLRWGKGKTILRLEQIPSWKAMCFIKETFFEDHETVVQFHPKKSNYVNNDKYTLHLWRNQAEGHKLPPEWMV